MVFGEPKPMSWEITWRGRGEGAVAGQRDGDLLSLRTKVKPKSAGKPLLSSRETGPEREPEAGSYILTICF